MKKKWVWVILAAALMISACFIPRTKAGVIWYLKQNQSEMTSLAELAMDCSDVFWPLGARSAEYEPQWDVTIFQVRYTGFGSQTDECGLYYASEDGFTGLGNDLEMIEQETGVKFLGDGDNWTMVEKIIDHWYWYERHW